MKAQDRKPTSRESRWLDMVDAQAFRDILTSEGLHGLKCQESVY
jgi:hypothetical protein